ncbi:MAG: response regulator, partial [Alphaproteobacteria bacterium]
DIVFVNYDMTPFNGRELSNMYAAVEKLRDIHFVLLTSYETGSENLQGLPDNVSVVQKHKDFMESIGELLIQWGVFGNIPHETPESGEAISQHPKTADVVKIITKRPLKILAAEDNPINQQLIKATIEAFGHQLEIAENGLLAIEAVKRGNFDLVFMDVRMPEMSGPEATRTIRQLSGDKSNIPIIAVTADATKEHKNEYFEVGMNECVGKPINRAELLEAIDKVMGEEIHIRVEVEVSENEEQETEEPTADSQDDARGEPGADLEALMKKLQDVADKYDEKK